MEKAKQPFSEKLPRKKSRLKFIISPKKIKVQF